VERLKAELRRHAFPDRALHEGFFKSGGGLVAVAHALERLACELGVEFRLATTVSRVSDSADRKVAVDLGGNVVRASHVLICPRTVPAGRKFIWRLSRPYEHLAESNIFLGPRDGEKAHIRCSRSGEVLTVASDSALSTAEDRLQIVDLMTFFGMPDFQERLIAERVMEFPCATRLLGSVQSISEDARGGALVLPGAETDLVQVTEFVRRILSSMRS
jgi:hypothetical protein